MKSIYNYCMKSIDEWKYSAQTIRGKKVVTLKQNKVTPPKGNVLISYITAPFKLKPSDNWPTSHGNYWECSQMARTFLDLGYEVDVIDWNDDRFVPKKDYAVFIDIHSNMERIAPFLREGCLKILHITGAHWLFQNHAEYTRLLKLQQRREITISPRRIVPPSLGIEYADCATIVGNEFAISTFSYANKPIYRIPLSSAVTSQWVPEKDFSSCRRTFLWIGSRGMVHKGLDLVLEAFTDLKDCELNICGLVQDETDFVKAYSKELYSTTNIKTHGWMDVASPDFFSLFKKQCAAVVYPSCSEGTAGSVITCLHFRLIPIITRESGRYKGFWLFVSE